MTIDKEQSYIIKGIAILLMLFHHFFTFPEWIICDFFTPSVQLAHFLNSPTKLCVSIFAFLSGWAFAIEKPSFVKAIKKIGRFMISYWSVALPVILFAVCFCDFSLSPIILIKELFGLSSYVMIFAWYVPFYIVSIAVMTMIYRYLDRRLFLAVIVGVILPMCLFSVLKRIPIDPDLQTLFNNLRHWFPCISAGYICNRYGLFELRSINRFTNNRLIVIGMICACFVGRYWVSGLDFIYCCVLVYAVLLLRIPNQKPIGKFLRLCGVNSANMWFLHCLYFGVATRSIIQPFVYKVKEPVFVFMAGVVQLLLGSCLIQKIKNILENVRKRTSVV